MFLTVNTELLTMLMTSLARDADALGSRSICSILFYSTGFVLHGHCANHECCVNSRSQ